MKNSFDAIVFGSATMDIFLTSEGFAGSSQGLVLPYDAKMEVARAAVCSGGGGTNVAVGLARLGLKTAAVARLGQDQFAPLVIEELRNQGVWTKMLAVEPGEETDYSTILVGPDGKKVILVSRGKTRLEEENISWNKLSANWFHLASLEGNLRLAKKIFIFAQRKKIKTSWNPGRRELHQREKVLSLLEKTDLLILNQEEMELLLGKKAMEKQFWPAVFNLPVALVAITRGEMGAWLAFPQEKEKQLLAPFSAQIVEATGAGDAFCSGLIAGLLSRRPPREAARWGLANGAAAVGCFGAKAGLLTKRGIKKWLGAK